jgi:CelD/BcsL family acetyltransferase involved in cellulose biosynthesis
MEKPMEFTLHNHFPESLRAEWDALLTCSISNVPFLLFDYLKLWWETRGGGEWKDAELFLVTAHEDGKLIGAAPLFFSRQHDNRPALLLVGSIEVSDYLDLLVAPQDLERFLDALLPFLAGQDMPAWGALDFYNIPQDSPLRDALARAAERQGWSFQEEKYLPCPFVTLKETWDDYLMGIKKKQRGEIRRKLRRLEEHAGIPSRWYVVDGPENLDEEIDAFLAMMEQNNEKQTFLSDQMRLHMANTIRFACDAGILHLSVLEIEGKRAASKLCFNYHNVLWAYNSAVDVDFWDYSPGWVLLSYVLMWAIEHGQPRFDFMRGGEEYKYRFGGEDRFVFRTIVTR